ncbi:MAG: nucleotide exchange factor GrpE [Bacteroidota bacterium]|nr:nucleotide exchange factor GrpE [Bacteroidota bacterium]
MVNLATFYIGAENLRYLPRKTEKMEENKENSEKELRDRVEEIKNSVTDKAEEFAKEAKGKAESFAGKTLDGVEKLINDVFKKNKPEEADFTEEVTDPKDIEIVELKKEMDQLRDKYVRLYADFDNFKKRTAKEKQDLIQTAGKDIMKDLLPVVDDFDRAVKALENSTDVNAAKDGMKLIHNKFVTNLSAKGLKAMESIGQDFNPDLHEAITEIPAPTPEQAGKVIDELEKGYYLNGKLIRFAKVIVGKQGNG